MDAGLVLVIFIVFALVISTGPRPSSDDDELLELDLHGPTPPHRHYLGGPGLGGRECESPDCWGRLVVRLEDDSALYLDPRAPR